MARQITHGSTVPALEHRVAVLERQVAALTEATRLLAAALEGTPLDPAADAAAPTARRAHELLLLPPLTPTSPH
ncbi:hypothetical protein [Actinomadura madurae]|uniref:hypothetical protein n=1 Tax=Actinomadura madurae TaxID=1993 RepID=UPI0020D25CD3|nr:hypothetical protein [Actinomadura madurae]MCP9948962.1 hypothetical protein [Actinomadura madurae]MCP9965735.1 hypothetical protein [Actinomadura madurae]MCP9978211.1 hypothetical protein [Actinomadura madurae]MCQ0010276.1 hypothetical protein [Actinomadura madurae]MCQ0014414.1 hypothetical protein [Actinomadura madurae]